MHSHNNTTIFGHSVEGCDCPNPTFKTPSWVEAVEGHTHTTKDGAIVNCYHQCRSTLLQPSFWVMTTLVFPIEHAIWVKIPLLHTIALWAGL